MSFESRIGGIGCRIDANTQSKGELSAMRISYRKCDKRCAQLSPLYSVVESNWCLHGKRWGARRRSRAVPDLKP